MKAYGLSWTPETLTAFIQSPATVVPGTTMAYPGQPDPTAARAVAEYLMGLKD
jgi:cytochrome c